MRTLGFRAWDGDHYIENCIVVDEQTIMVFDEGNGFYEMVEVDCVEQDTGLKDKNGKKIYEGDIVEKCYNKAKKLYSSAPVEFERGVLKSAGWNLCKFAHKCEVIGNVHENKEWLK